MKKKWSTNLKRLTSSVIAIGVIIMLLALAAILVPAVDAQGSTSPEVKVLVKRGSRFGAKGITFDDRDRLHIASIFGREAIVMNPDSGEILDRTGINEYKIPSSGDCHARINDDPTDYTSVQVAVDVANPGDLVKVAGTCRDVQVRDGDPQTVFISKTLTLRGGYTTTNWTTPDPDANPTTLDAQGQGRVLYITGDISPTVEGLRITGGDAAGLGGSPWGLDCGGGVYLYQRDASSAATLNNNQVFGNTAEWHGGGLCVRFSAAKLNGNTIFSNTAKNGGGLWLDFGDGSTLSSNVFTSNAADGGGGLYLYVSAAALSGNTVSGNTANSSGGGLYLDGSAATLDGNFVSGNSANGTNLWDGGGGLLVRVSDAILINNVIADNRGGPSGSGLKIRGGSPRLLHNTIARNTGGDGSGVYIVDKGGMYGSIALTNTILISHSVGISVTGGNTVTVNGVLWYNTPITVSQETTSVVTLQDQHEGDPAFAADGYHLTANSAAIDKGANAGVTADIDGEPRPIGAGYDLGADEYKIPSSGDCHARINDDPTDYTSVQAAVDAANPGDLVKVAGTCRDVQVRDGDPQTVFISKTLTLRGGYTTTNWTTPDPDANPTTLDAQGQGRVLYITGDISPTIEGLRITGGDAAGLGGSPWGLDCGGGVYLYQRDASTAATLSNNYVFGNTSSEHGGGLCAHISFPTLDGNTVFSNTAESGGGLWLDHSEGSTLSNNVVANNHAAAGGGLYLYASDTTLNGNTFIGNTADDGGGGLYLDGSPATLDGNFVSGNSANGTNLWDGGGGLLVRVSDATLRNNVVTDNKANLFGGGLRVRGSSFRLLHTTIARNGDSGGVYVTDEWGTYSTVVLTNTILVSHSVGISVTGGNTVTVNSILWHSTPITVSSGVTAVVSIQNQREGDPAFALDGYHITPASAAMDAGIDGGTTTDIDGHHRPYNYVPDLGADEIIAASVATGLESSLVYTDTQRNPTIIEVPAAAVTETIILAFAPVENVTAPSGLSLAGHAFSLKAYRDGALLAGFTFEQPITVTIHYTDADVAGLNEHNLVLRYWNGSDWVSDGIVPVERNTAQNYVVFTVAHLSDFALFTVEEQPIIAKSVTPTGQLAYDDELTYTLVVSVAPGVDVGLYDALEGTRFTRFLEQPLGITHSDGTVTGTLTLTANNQITVSFVAKIITPTTQGMTVTITNRACVYPFRGTLGGCIWSDDVTNTAFRPYSLYLPLVLRNHE